MPQRTTTKPDTTYFEPAKVPTKFNFEVTGQEMWVPLWMVYPKPTQQRQKFLQSKITEFAESMKENGQKTVVEVMYKPLTPEDLLDPSWDDEVVEDDEPRPGTATARPRRRDAIILPDDWETGNIPCLMIKTGETRHRSRLQGRFQMIRVVVRPLVEGLELEIDHGIENLNRQDIDSMSEARYYHKLHTVYGLSVDEIAKRVGISQSQKFRIIWRLKLMNLSDRWMQLTARGHLTIQHKGKEKKIEVGDEHLRIVAEIVDNDPVSGDQVPRHDLQDMVLEAVISEAKRTGKLTDKEKLKRMRDHIIMPPAQQDALEMLLPASPHTDKAIQQLKAQISMTWKLSTDLLNSQREGDPSRALEYIGEVDAEGLSRILEVSTKNLKSLQRLIDETSAANFARGARAAADEAMADLLSTDDILAQMDEAA